MLNFLSETVWRESFSAKKTGNGGKAPAAPNSSLAIAPLPAQTKFLKGQESVREFNGLTLTNVSDIRIFSPWCGISLQCPPKEIKSLWRFGQKCRVASSHLVILLRGGGNHSFAGDNSSWCTWLPCISCLRCTLSAHHRERPAKVEARISSYPP